MEPSSSPSGAYTRAEFEKLVEEIRPQLHRYASRMLGSVLDGEDVVQEALAKAFNSLSSLSSNSNLQGWLFRIVHNKAIDFLRQGGYQSMERLDEYTLLAEPDVPLEEKELVTVALSVFLKLAPKQRSCVILKDVLGYSLAEISELLNSTVPEIKAALHRGRTRLRELAAHLEENGPASVPDERERARLTRYIELFNAQDFEAVQAMLTEDVRLELLNRVKKQGISELRQDYFTNYTRLHDWFCTLGYVENRLAILVSQPYVDSSQPDYFILLSWREEKVELIRDYRYARYVMQEAEVGKI